MAVEVADQQLGFAARTGQWLGYLLLASLGLLTLALTSGSLGNLSRALYGVLAVVCLIGLAFAWPRRRQPVSPWILAGALVLMSASLLMAARGGPLGILGAGIFFFALSLLPLRNKALVTALLLTTLLFASVRILIAYWPAAWHFEQWLAGSVSWVVGVGLILGPTALGSSLVILFGLFALSVFLLSMIRRPLPSAQAPNSQTPGRGRKAILFLVWVAGLLLAVVAYIWLQPPLGSLVLTYWPEPLAPSPEPQMPPTLTYLDSQLLLFALLWFVTALASLGLRPRALPLAPAKSGRVWLVAGLVLLTLGTTILTLEAPLRPRQGAILFYDDGHLDWDVPAFGQYGPYSGGDFGLWPAYLEAYGYEARFGPLTADNLAGARAVVTINMPANLEDPEKQRLLAYVEEGGGLLIWGEHTGVHGIREPINDLLAGVPIRLLFDSAVPSRQGWAEGLTFLPHASTYGIQNPIDLVLAVGASLEIAPPAQPFIVGQYGHSDAGDVSNPARNYVGDMRYNPGERLGDVVLAAWAPYGRGRIAVVGDTTPLGSVNLMTSMPFHARLLAWVTAEAPKGASALLGITWLVGLLLVLASVCLVVGRSRTALAGALMVLGLVLGLTTYANTAGSAPQFPNGPIAYVDAGHQERFDRMLWQDSSIGGLDYNLVRSGALPLLTHNLDTEILAGAKLLIIIAPGDHFSAGEMATISQWVEAGGRLLVSTGWEESAASQRLLAKFGLAVDHIPLGPVEVERESGLVRFHEAWPLSATHSDAEIVVEGYGYPLIVHQPWGQGSVVLIGDSQLLLGSTLEGEAGYEVGNIMLLRDIMSMYLGFDDPAALTTRGGS